MKNHNIQVLNFNPRDGLILTVLECARLLQLTKGAIYQAITLNRLEARWGKNKWMITLNELEKYRKTRYQRCYSKHNGKLIFDKDKGEYSVTETANLLNVPAQQIYYSCRSSKIKSTRKRSSWVINITDIEEYKKTMNVRKKNRKI